MENNTNLHPTHPTLQFEAKHAIRFLDNLLRTRTTAFNCHSNLFDAVGIFAEGRDIKEDFTSLLGHIGDYDFKWNRNTLECTCESMRNVIRHGTFEEDFGDAPCDFLNRLWDCSQQEVRVCVRAAVSRLAKRLSEYTPAADGGVAMRFKTLVRSYRLNAKERDLLLIGLCEAHRLLEYDLDNRQCCGRNFLLRLEEASHYLGCGVDAILPLVRNNSKLIAFNLLDDDLTLSRSALEYLEGHVAVPNIRSDSLSTFDFTELPDESDCE